jgi:PASTA domain
MLRLVGRAIPRRLAAAAITIAAGVIAVSPTVGTAGASGKAAQAAANANFIGKWTSTPTTWVITAENLSTGVCKGPPVGSYKLSDCQVTGDSYKFQESYAGVVYSYSGVISGNTSTGASIGPQGTLHYTTHRSVICVVPKLKGLTVAAAKKALHKNHCSIRVVRSPSTRARAGRIFYSSPSAGQWANDKDKVLVDVSTG